MPPEQENARVRLGRLLAARRPQISPRYRNRRLFAAERGMNWRTLHDMELAKRDNFRPETMRAFESAYMLEPGSLDRTLAGGDLEPLPEQEPPSRAAPASLAGMPDLTDDEDQELAALLLSRPLTESDRDILSGILRMRTSDGPRPWPERRELMIAWLTMEQRRGPAGESGRSRDSALPENQVTEP